MKIPNFNSLIAASILIFVFSGVSPSYSWHDKTHLAVAKTAGYERWYNAAGADITKIKIGDLEKRNHYFNNSSNVPVTEKLILDQADYYNNPNDEKGHLYGAIIASLREYKRTTSTGKYAEYHLAFTAHYIGDLSAPLHHIEFDDYNKIHHYYNDGVVEDEVLNQCDLIQKHMYRIELRPDHFEEDIIREIARIAGATRNLGLRLRTERRDMTKSEAYVQLGHSSSLLKAVLKVIK